MNFNKICLTIPWTTALAIAFWPFANFAYANQASLYEQTLCGLAFGSMLLMGWFITSLIEFTHDTSKQFWFLSRPKWIEVILFGVVFSVASGFCSYYLSLHKNFFLIHPDKAYALTTGVLGLFVGSVIYWLVQVGKSYLQARKN